MTSSVGWFGGAGAGGEDVVAARRNAVGELLPCLSQLPFEAVARDRVANSLWYCKAEPWLAGRVVITGKPVQRQVARRNRPALPVNRIEVLRP